jgi:hypothetical protein
MERRAADGRFVTDDRDAARKAQARGIESNTTWDLVWLALRLGWVDAGTVFGYVTVLRGRSRPVPRALWVGGESFQAWVRTGQGG